MTSGVRNLRAGLVTLGVLATSAVVVSVGAAADQTLTVPLLWALAVVAGLGGVYVAIRRPPWSGPRELRRLGRTSRLLVLRSSARGEGLPDRQLAGVAAGYAHGMRRAALGSAGIAAMFGCRSAYMAAQSQSLWPRWDVVVSLAVTTYCLTRASRFGRAEAANERISGAAAAARAVE